VFEDRIWAIGGRSGSSDFGDVYIYDGAADDWTVGPSIEPRGTAGATVFQGAIWLIGGESQARARSLDSVLRLDGARGVWREAPPLPTARNYARSVVLREMIWTIGGSPTAGASHSSAGSAIVERFAPLRQSPRNVAAGLTRSIRRAGR
jgi:N-acetylneuraminic acid mutarotase